MRSLEDRGCCALLASIRIKSKRAAAVGGHVCRLRGALYSLRHTGGHIIHLLQQSRAHLHGQYTVPPNDQGWSSPLSFSGDGGSDVAGACRARCCCAYSSMALRAACSSESEEATIKARWLGSLSKAFIGSGGT